MRFTKLRLNGFKSFVDPTDLVIADGLTGIVGPNGCGKSNLLEALRWVMGENRPTAMRGGGMEDVIFAGAASRPARNFAEVAITLDNSERLAPSGFNDHDTLEIVRRITLDAGSAYRAGGQDARARDVQMLFADASTGAHSPALVRQGQISELINARPKNRRRILEEAAGISGLYQRRHEAELKLSGAEANLSRVEDVLEQLAQQLAQLSRQARQAARYREIGAQLRRAEGLLLYRLWKEAEEAHLTADDALREHTRAAAQAEGKAQKATRERDGCEAALPPLREEEAIAAAILQRLAVERDTLRDQEARAGQAIEALTARIGQLTHDIERETVLNRDAGDTIERLEREQDDLAAAESGHGDNLETASAEAAEATRLLEKHEAEMDERTEAAGQLSARHQSAHRTLEDAHTTLARSSGEAGKAHKAAAETEAALATLADDLAVAGKALSGATLAAVETEAALVAADSARAEAQTREATARAGQSEAEGEASALRAEVAALARLVEREAGEGAHVLDLVTVAPGYEAALGAALADDLRASEVDETTASGWARLPDYPATQPLPEGAAPLSNHVQVPAVLNRRMTQVGLVVRDAGTGLQAQLRPGQRLVSVEGDLWRWDGFRAAAEDAPTAAALQLQQLNRLVQLKRDLEDATARAEGAAQAHGVLAVQLAELTAADHAARTARRDADRALSEANRRLSRAEADHSIAAGKLESLRLAASRHEDEAEAARRRVAEAEAGVAGLEDLSAARALIEGLREQVEAARVAMMVRRAAYDELKRAGEARARRRNEIAGEIEGWRHRLETAGKRVAELEARRSSGEAELEEARARPAEIAARREEMAVTIEAAEARRRGAADALALAETGLRNAEQERRGAERAASDAREARARSEAVAEAAQAQAQAAAHRIGEELGTSPAELLHTLKADPDKMPAADKMEAEVNRLKRQRDALGAVNLRAEEDARGIEAEHDALAHDMADLQEAIAKLRAGIASLNREGRERLLTAFEEVNSNFATLFAHLFGGGEARLVLVESDDPLEAGLEIMCHPPGKKLSTLSLLSGGEQTLTALALIFAVFLANPAPICVLDEVDAPLDDANVTRFCDLLDEMARRTETRFLIITHHAITMARMDRLYGVTMAEPGVSQLVSVDLKKAEAMVA